MKKILLVCLVCASFHAIADMVPVPTICKDNGWVQVFAQHKNIKKHSYRGNYSQPFCILPNGEHYSSFTLERNKDDTLKHLFDQYSGQQPTFEQIENAKKQIKKDGYLFD